MSHRRPVSDLALRRALTELAEGPAAGPGLVAEILEATEGMSRARGFGWPLGADRRVALVTLLALLAMSLLGLLAWAGSRPPERVTAPLPVPVFVTQSWNGLIDPDSVISYTAYDPATGIGTVLATPTNALGARWSPDGARVVYTTVEAAMLNGLGGLQPRLRLQDMVIANGDGTGPTAVQLPRSLGYEGAPVTWAPQGDRFAVFWSSGECSGGEDCLPAGEIQVFDATGEHVSTVPTTQDFGLASWSPDGRAVGWFTGSCPDGRCTTDAFHWRDVVSSEPETSIAIPDVAAVRWTDDGRLVAFTLDATVGLDGYKRYRVARLFTMRPDGLDVRDVPWTVGLSGYHSISPTGRHIAVLDPTTLTLSIRDLKAAQDVRVNVPDGFELGPWSPDSRWLVLWRDSTTRVSEVTYAVASVDGGELRILGQGELDGESWAPVTATGR